MRQFITIFLIFLFIAFVATLGISFIEGGVLGILYAITAWSGSIAALVFLAIIQENYETKNDK